MNKNLKAAIIALLSAIPFILAASFFGIAQESIIEEGMMILVGFGILLLGAPLTLLPSFVNFQLSYRSTLFLLDFLFIIQWIIWSQLIVYIYRKFSKSKK